MYVYMYVCIYIYIYILYIPMCSEPPVSLLLLTVTTASLLFALLLFVLLLVLLLSLLLLVVVVVLSFLPLLSLLEYVLMCSELGRGDDTVGNPHRAQISRFELFELILLSKLDKQLPVEQCEATVSQSTAPSPPLRSRRSSYNPHLGLINGPPPYLLFLNNDLFHYSFTIKKARHIPILAKTLLICFCDTGDTSCAILGVIHFHSKRDPPKSDQLYT